MILTILEDRPHNMLQAIDKMEEMGIHTQNMVYFHSKKSFYSPDKKSELEKELNQRQVTLIEADNNDLKKILDKLYHEEDMSFFFDMDLWGDYSHHFLERINVQYALEKKELEQDDGRIWFYTTGPRSAIEQIKANFPNRYIPIIKYDTRKDLVILDYDFIKENVLK